MIHFAYITGDELYKSLSIRDNSRFNRLTAQLMDIPSLYLLIKANILLSSFPAVEIPEESIEVQRALAVNLLAPHNWRILSRPEFNQRPLFHRQQMLLMIKKILRFSRQVPVEDILLNDEQTFSLGRLCVNASNLLTSRSQEKILDKLPLAEVGDQLLLQFLPPFELFNPPAIDKGVARTLEYLRLLNELCPVFADGMSLDEYFKTRTGISLNTFLFLVIGIYTHYYNRARRGINGFLNTPENFNLRKSNYFSNLSIDSTEIEAFFSLTCRSIPEFKEELGEENSGNGQEQYDFTVFRKYPLIYVFEQNVFSCVDIGLLLEKVTMGLYRMIHNALPDDPGNPGRKEQKIADLLHSRWASTVETYTGSLIAQQSGIHTNVEFNFGRSDNKQIDFIIGEGDDCSIIEVKGGSLSAKKYAGSRVMIDELNEKFGIKENKSGVRQLVRDIEILFNSRENERRRLRNFNCPTEFLKAKNIYPVLIVEESSLRLDLAQYKLQLWFEEEKQKRSHNIDSNITISTLLVLPIESLEELEPYLEAGDFTFFDFVRYYAQHMRRNRPFHDNPSYLVLNNFLAENRISPRVNQRISDRFSDFVKTTAFIDLEDKK